ncbi:MAG: EamA family transporter [Bacteroidota bacterium]
MDWYLIAFTSALLSAFAAISQKKILFEMDAFDFSLILSIVNAIIALILIPAIQFDEISTTSLIILYGKTILGAVAFLFVMLAIKNLEISGALPLMILTPALVAAFAWIFIGESISQLDILGMATLLIGIYLLETSNSSSLLESFRVFKKSRYKHYLLGAILLFTISSVIDKHLLKDHHLAPISFLFFQQVFLAINFLILSLFLKRNVFSIVNDLNIKLFSWILLISIFTIGYRYSLLEAIKIAPVALVLSIKRTSIFFATILGGKIFSEHSLLKRGVAALLMLIGVYFIIVM